MKDEPPILLVEDDCVDVMMVKRAFRDLGVRNELIVAENGEAGLRYLQEVAEDLPSLVLLDINMPRMNGFEFLESVKQDPVLCTIPVVILTSSCAEEDKWRGVACCASGYMLKPVKYERLVEVLRTIYRYWSLSQLPSGRRS